MSALRDIVKQVEPSKQPIATGLVTEISFMKTELAKLRKQIRQEGATEIFVNGKQRMTRQTPAFQAYNSLIARYGTLCKQLASLVPDGAAGQGDELDAFLRELRG